MITFREYLERSYGFDFSQILSDQVRPYRNFQISEVIPAHELLWMKYHKPKLGKYKAAQEAAAMHYCSGGHSTIEGIMQGVSFSHYYKDVMNILGKEPWSSLAESCENDWVHQAQECLDFAGRRMKRYLSLDESLKELQKSHIGGNVILIPMSGFIRAADPTNPDGHAHLPSLEEAAEIVYLSKAS